jgi:hypothetical protein
MKPMALMTRPMVMAIAFTLHPFAA